MGRQSQGQIEKRDDSHGAICTAAMASKNLDRALQT
jgi:hypothetical protein